MDINALLQKARDLGTDVSIEITKISEQEESIEVIIGEDEIRRRDALEEIEEDYTEEELAEMDEDEIDDLIKEYMDELDDDEEEDD